MRPHSALTVSACILSLLGVQPAAADDRLVVENPGDVQLGKGFTVEWELDREGHKLFDIELYEGSSCDDDDPVVDLCGYNDPAKAKLGCGDSSGDYNVLIPDDVDEGQYSILVRLHDEPDVEGCSGGFKATTNQPEGDEDAELKVYSPGDGVQTGIEFDAKWKYDDGNDVTQGRFSIDLYEADCEGDLVAALCEEDDGCPDSAGDYPVTIPTSVLSGTYSLKVGVFNAASPIGCSPPFTVEASTAGATIDTSVVVPSPWPEKYQPTKPPCDAEKSFDVRYAGSTERVYFEHADGSEGGCAKLSDVLTLRSETNGTIKGPLYPIDPDTGEKYYHVNQTTGHWLIESDIYVRNGITLQLWGAQAGGDCDSLRILSTDKKYYNLRAHGGSLDIMDTVITSWDTDLSPPGPRLTDQTISSDDEEGRSYISCISEIVTDSAETCYGNAKNTRGECRMDIVRSEIAYLGFFGPEAYGLTWKVRGFCKDKSNPEVFNAVNTYGDVIDSDIHHLFYGLYTYGHLGGLWTGNDMHDNEWYGFDPHDDSDYLTIHNNKVWGNGKHGIIASKRCNHVSIQNNEVWDGGEPAAGIFLHRSSDNALVMGNYIHDMQDSGLAALESFDITFKNNRVERCRYGVRLSLGAARNSISLNTFESLKSYGFFTYVGSNKPDVAGDVYRPYENLFKNNIVAAPAVAKIKEADDTIFVDNTLVDSVLLEIDDSRGTKFKDNHYNDLTTRIKVKNSACFTADSDLAPDCD